MLAGGNEDVNQFPFLWITIRIWERAGHCNDFFEKNGNRLIVSNEERFGWEMCEMAGFGKR